MSSENLPALVEGAGPAAAFVEEGCFSGGIRNPHTRRAYAHAVRRFLAWAEGKELVRINPGLGEAPKDTPLFRSALGKTGLLAGNAPTDDDLGRMVNK